MCDQNANNPPLNVTPQSAALTSLPKAVERLMLSQGINQSGREQEFVSFLHMFFMFHVKDNTLCGANLLFKFTQGHTLYSTLSPAWTDQTHWEAGEIEVTKEKF